MRLWPRQAGLVRPAVAALAGSALLAGCALFADPTATPEPPGTPSPEPVATPSPATPSPAATPAPPTAAPTPTPEPPLSLALPDERDERRIGVAVDRALPADDDGRIIVTVTNLADSRIDEIVLRWPTDLREALFLAPFVPSADRIRDGGPPLVQPWTRWVEGPGEQGEPDGTTSLGYGPMDPGMVLEIALFATRNTAGPVAFDLQLLAGEALLTLDDGSPAGLRLEVP